MRLMVSAGATGGGINPALAVLQALGEKSNQILWVGSEGGMEADLVGREGVPFTTIPAAGIHGVGLKAISALWKLTRGFFAARKLIRDFKPDVLFFTGGYVAIPTGLAGLNIPTLICLPDIEPGLALKVLSRFADHIAVPAEESRAYFPKRKRVTVVGYPIRPDMTVWERKAAFEAFGLSPDKPTLTVTGGSLGARSINRALVAILPELLPKMQVVHLTGKLTWPEVEAVRDTLPNELLVNYRAYPYLYDRMGAAFSVADLVVSRAGASILGELPVFGVPAILVPYPHAWRYQKVNADYLAKQGGAIVVKDEELNEKLSSLIMDLMGNQSKRSEMKAAMESMANPGAAASIAALLNILASDNPQPTKRGGAQ
jgi:UDP-N-acetylglucosamine--N-acetylmuramyl-(pentapeptide) pyrophosphoryl-undecaprenol N-acetylglucosamine transferase